MTRRLGAVLTGGASRRMGRDKALIEVEGTAMVDRVAAALRTCCADVVAIGPASLAGGLRAVADQFPGEGPLGGVLTALAFAGSDYDAVVIAACDLPWLDADTVEVVAAGLTADIDVAVAHTERIEPLCAAWRPATATALEQIFAGGERALHEALRQLRVRSIDVDSAPLRNVNAPDDLISE